MTKPAIRSRAAALRSRRSVHAALLASASAVTLLASAPAARAGNILVQGLAASGASATAAAISAAQQAAAMAQQAQNSLARTTLAIQAMQAAQSAARSLALQA